MSDLYLFNLIYGLAHRYAILNWFVVFSARYLIYILVVIFILLLIFKYDWRKRLYLLSLSSLSIIISRGIITELVRFFYYRPRPFVELNLPLTDHSATASLPSGHMAFLIPLALLIWHEDREIGKWFIFLTLLVGVSRVALGVHWPTDILLGIAVGTTIFYVVKKFLPKP